MSDRYSYWNDTVAGLGGAGTVERLNEILFGLIMVLTFTCSISAATAGHEEISTILWSALGCNIAWGFVDSFMYLFTAMLERGEMFANVRRVRNTKEDADVSRTVKDAFPSLLWDLMKAEHILYLKDQISKLPEPPAKVSLTKHDLRQAFMIFLLVFLSTFPVTLPFLFFHNELLAMRVSNGIALVLLFIVGAYLGNRTGRKMIPMGLAFAVIGFVLVGVTMALGG